MIGKHRKVSASRRLFAAALVAGAVAAPAAGAAPQPGVTGETAPQPGTTTPQAPTPAPTGYAQPATYQPPAPAPVSEPAAPIPAPVRATPPKAVLPGPSVEVGYGFFHDSAMLAAPVDYAFRQQATPFGLSWNGASRVGDWGGTIGVSLNVHADGLTDLSGYLGTRNGTPTTMKTISVDSPLVARLSGLASEVTGVSRETRANQSTIVEGPRMVGWPYRLPAYIQVNRHVSDA